MTSQDMFSAKDRTAYRYFFKRAHYLAVIADGLKKAAKKDGPIHGVQVTWEQADERRPIISISAGKAQGLKHNVDIRIHASVPQDTFPLATLYPSKSLIRSGDDESTPTPQCSTSILHDTLQKAHLVHLHRIAQSLSGGDDERVAAKFLALWRIWASRRGVDRARGGSAWFASMLLGWVVEGGEVGGVGGERGATKRARGLGHGLGAWGALRAAWEFLAHTDFDATPVFMAGSTDGIPKAEFTGAFSDVFVDPTGTVNVFAEWERGDVELLRHHARETLAMLEDASIDRFAEVFLQDQTLGPASFDEYTIVTIDPPSSDVDIVEEAEWPSAIERQAHRAASILRRGLTNRVTLVHTAVRSATTLEVGLILNGVEGTRMLDMGPASTDEVNGAVFRELWGDRADLRRFKDGTIAESVVWEVARPEDAALIPFRAIQWLMKRHLAAESVSVSSTPEWLSILQVPESVRDAINTQGSERLGFSPMFVAYETLYKLLKGIDSELPLAVLNVSPATEMLRYSSPFVPHPLDVARAASAPECLSYAPIAEIVLQFESSPRWPDDLAAIQKLKLALLEKIARVVEGRMRGVRATVAIDAGASDIEDAASLEIMLPAGSAFRIRIYHERECTLLERALQPPPPGIPNQLPQPPRRLVAPALALHLRRFIHAPMHHGSLAPMHHRFPSFSTATRLLKRWAAAHLLSGLITSEALELIAAHVYLDSGSRGAPMSATAGFLRALAFLSTWDWAAQPAFVPLQAVTRDAASRSGRPRFDAAKRTEALAAFEKRRHADKDVHSAAWVLPTEEDVSGVRWTAGTSKVVAGRMAALAAASLALVRDANAKEEVSLDVAHLFATPLEHYNAVLHLSTGTRAAEAVGTPDAADWESALSFRSVPSSTSTARLAFDPATLFVDSLRRTYGDAALFFHDAHGGRTVGVLWNPTAAKGGLVPRAFKPFVGFNAKPARTKGEAALVEINKQAVLGEIARMGRGIVERIEVR